MDFAEHLKSLEWNTFAKYPDQGESIYLHCSTEDGSVHKFVKISKFNAVSFRFENIVMKFQSNNKWQFSWLPEKSVRKKL